MTGKRLISEEGDSQRLFPSATRSRGCGQVWRSGDTVSLVGTETPSDRPITDRTLLSRPGQTNGKHVLPSSLLFYAICSGEWIRCMPGNCPPRFPDPARRTTRGIRDDERLIASFSGRRTALVVRCNEMEVRQTLASFLPCPDANDVG